MAYKSHWAREGETNLVTDIVRGLYFGYDLCCISNFIRLKAATGFAAQHMWEMHGYKREHGHVKCHNCFSNLNKPLRRSKYKDLAQRYWPYDESIEDETYLLELE